MYTGSSFSGNCEHMAKTHAHHSKKPSKLSGARLKALPPTLRERARYVRFEIISEAPLHGNAAKDLVHEIQALLGVAHSAEAGLIPLDYNENVQRGVLRTTSKGLLHVKACFAMIFRIQGIPSIVRSLKTSGMLHNVQSNVQS